MHAASRPLRQADRHGINQAVGVRRKSRDLEGERLGDELLEAQSETVQTPVEGLITGQMGEPRAPVLASVIVDAALLPKALHVPEQIDGYEFLVRETGTKVRETLIFQSWVFIVSPADAQVESDELLFHKLNSTPLLPSAFLLLIRINDQSL